MPKTVAAVHLSLNESRPIKLTNKLQASTQNKNQTQLKRRLQSKFKIAKASLRDSEMEVRTSLNSSLLAPSSMLVYSSQPQVLYKSSQVYNSVDNKESLRS